MQSNVKNEYMGNGYGMLMLWMLGSFDRCNVRGECENGGMLGMNVLIGAILGVNVLIGAMLGVNVEIGEC